MTAIDTNVLIAFGNASTLASKPASAALEKASAAGPLCICGAVFAELLGSPGRNGKDLRILFATLGISVEWRLEEADWESAGLAYQGYVSRRRASGGGLLPRRIATDFIIGAHASLRGYSLLTLDKRLFNAAFPSLRIESF
jgi:predicted nucleic acid-binding protein